MSSFVISKEEYIKAAGFFAGIAEQKNFYKENVIYWWSDNKKRILTADDYYFAFFPALRYERRFRYASVRRQSKRDR